MSGTLDHVPAWVSFKLKVLETTFNNKFYGKIVNCVNFKQYIGKHIHHKIKTKM